MKSLMEANYAKKALKSVYKVSSKDVFLIHSIKHIELVENFSRIYLYLIYTFNRCEFTL